MFERLRYWFGMKIDPKDHLEIELQDFVDRQSDRVEPLPLPPTVKEALRRRDKLQCWVEGEKIVFETKDGVTATLFGTEGGEYFTYRIDDDKGK